MDVLQMSDDHMVTRANLAAAEGLLWHTLKLRFDGQAAAIGGEVNFAGYVQDHPGRC
jgi:hypothetical protein